MNQQNILQQHPSVQDLSILAPGAAVNPSKAHFHSLVINSGPLHQPSDSGVKKKQVPKDQTVKVIKNEANLMAAALCRSDVGKFKVTNTATNNSSSSSAVKKPGDSGDTKRSGASSTGADKLPPIGSAGKTLSSAVAGGTGAPPTVGNNTTGAKAGDSGAKPPCGHQRPPSTITTSVVSVKDAASDAESFSMYSCSCCNVRPASSRNSNYSEYENMTSVSQRPSNHPSAGKAASVTSSKLRTLESELNRERVDREKTQKELELIKQRQNFLLSRLTEEEREKLANLMKQQEGQ